MEFYIKSKKMDPAVVVKPKTGRRMGYIVPAMENDGQYHNELVHMAKERAGEREKTLETKTYEIEKNKVKRVS